MLLLSSAAIAGVDDDGSPRIDRAWARPTPGAATTGAVYLRIESPTGDRLVGLSSPVAAKAELHTHVEENGAMQMREVEGGLTLPAGQPVELKPGGLLHVMLVGLNRKLRAGDDFPLTLSFDKAGTRDVTVTVERLGAMGPSEDDPVRHSAAHTGMSAAAAHPAEAHPTQGANP